MGKRKSKTAKQRQVRSAQRGLGKAFGRHLIVSGASKSSSGTIGTTIAAAAAAGGGGTNPTKLIAQRQKESQHGTSSGTTQKTERFLRKKRFTTKVSGPSSRKNGSKIDDEDNEFRKQQASLMEREMVVEWRRVGRCGKAGMMSSSTEAKEPITGAAASSLAFIAPASFQLPNTAKSTQQLLQEVSNGVETLGVSAPPPKDPFSHGSLLSALPRVDTITNHSNNNNYWTIPNDQERRKNNNPWAVLDDQEDEDAAAAKLGIHDGKNMTMPSSKMNPFQFAPASFALGVDVDPDL